jgi:diguanylate cyclase (GGDEF)-like protein
MAHVLGTRMAPKLLDSKITEETALHDARAARPRGRALGGLLFCACALLLALGTLTLERRPPAWVFAVIALGVVTGIACVLIPWERIPSLWLHAVPVVAAFELTAVVWGMGSDGMPYSWLYLIVVVTVAYAFKSRAVIAGHLGIVFACLAVPLADPSIGSGDSFRNLMVSGPTLMIAAVLVTYFRERLEAGKQVYRELSRMDPLTGVGNYRTFYERLDYEIVRHQRHHRRFAVMLLDLNSFKHVNDIYGHLEGDRVLAEVGQALTQTVRDEDSVARQGGDEFSVLAPETTWGEVVTLAARIRAALAKVSAGDRVLSTGIGWAIYPENGETIEQLLAHADLQLRESKHQSPEHQPEAVAPGLAADARAVRHARTIARAGRASAV